MILLVRESAGEFPKYKGTQHALAVAVLLERRGAGRLAEDHAEDGRVWLRPVDTTPLGDEVLDEALAVIDEAGGTAAELVGLVVPGLHVRLLDRLVARGVLMPRVRRRHSMTSKFLWRVADTTRREQLRAWLAAALLNREAPDQWSAALISLLCAVDAVDEVVPGPAAEARAQKIARADWPADSVMADMSRGTVDVAQQVAVAGAVSVVAASFE